MFFRIIFKFSLDLRYAENGDSDQLLCIHLPDYTSAEVGPVMSLLYYGEVWLSDTYIGIYEVTIIVYSTIYIKYLSFQLIIFCVKEKINFKFLSDYCRKYWKI